MHGDAAQEPKLVCTQPQHVVQPLIGPVQVERAVQLPLLAEHACGQFVGEPAITLGQSG
jgi:hypothetical protein